ncbi:MAG: phosphatidate cytidylyltransferase, partial [Clostridia bacterium]
MLKRIITAVVALAVFVPVLYFSQTFIFPIVISLLSTVACYEMLKCIKLDKSYLLAIPCLIAAAAIPILARYLPAAGFTIFLALFCIIIAISVFGFKKYDVGTLSIVFYELFLVIFGFFSIVLLRDAEPYKYLLIFIAAWGTDTFAYFSGYFLGKRKLCPDISPKKTI